MASTRWQGRAYVTLLIYSKAPCMAVRTRAAFCRCRMLLRE
jgi:hypothetical protein